MNRINPDGISHAKLEDIAKGYEFRGVVSGEEEDCLIGKYIECSGIHIRLEMTIR